MKRFIWALLLLVSTTVHAEEFQGYLKKSYVVDSNQYFPEGMPAYTTPCGGWGCSQTRVYVMWIQTESGIRQVWTNELDWILTPTKFIWSKTREAYVTIDSNRRIVNVHQGEVAEIKKNARPAPEVTEQQLYDEAQRIVDLIDKKDARDGKNLNKTKR
jgi:hypothetical protein